METNERYIKRVGKNGVTLWTWTEELSKKPGCFEISKKEFLHLKDPKNNPAPANLIDIQHLDDDLVTMLGGFLDNPDKKKQLMAMIEQMQHGREEFVSETAIDIPPVSQVSVDNKEDDTGYEKIGNEEPEINKNGRPSKTALARMSKAQLQEHSRSEFPNKPFFDIEDPLNTNDFIREKITEWWDEKEGK